MSNLARNLRFAIFFGLCMKKAIIKDNSQCVRDIAGGWTFSFSAGEEHIWTSFQESYSKILFVVVTKTKLKLV